VHRNHFGRQVESFEADLRLEFLDDVTQGGPKPFHAIFIRAPVVDKILAHADGVQAEEAGKEGTVVAPSKAPRDPSAAARVSEQVQVLGVLSRAGRPEPHAGDIVAVKQGNVFGTSFHPELTEDARIHVWWLGQVLEASDSG